MLGRILRFIIGQPLSTADAPHQRLSNPIALAVFASDALSSVAYATEEILLVLVLAGSAAAQGYTLPIAAAILLLLLVVGFSYRQTIEAYPGGGGAYLVARENLGVPAGLVAGAALLIDYVLTVSVSIAAGVAAITSALPALNDHKVALGAAAIAFIAIANLRGVKESGSLFAVPTYAFVVAIGLTVAVGLGRLALGAAPAAPPPVPATLPLTTFLVLRAFSSGCTALTGVEAISNGVTAFREPVSRNAARTLLAMVGLLGGMFLGLTVLAHAFGVLARGDETVVSQLARAVFGGGPIYYFVQATTAMILLLAANTSFADFPRLASLLARDGFLPRQLANLGDRLVFSNGIIVLAVLSGVLLGEFGGDTHALIPLYCIGVFLSFTLSQAGMVVHWRRLGGPSWVAQAAVNGVGALTTAVVLGVIAATKFTHGAWMVLVLVPVLVAGFVEIRRHYRSVERQLTLEGVVPPRTLEHFVIVPVSGLHRGVVAALEYARSLTDKVIAVTVEVTPEATERLREQWSTWGAGTRLVVLKSPYRSLLRPLAEFIDELDALHPDELITIVIPEFVPRRFWHNFLHNQSALQIRTALRSRRGKVVTTFPLHLE